MVKTITVYFVTKTVPLKIQPCPQNLSNGPFSYKIAQLKDKPWLFHYLWGIDTCRQIPTYFTPRETNRRESEWWVESSLLIFTFPYISSSFPHFTTHPTPISFLGRLICLQSRFQIWARWGKKYPKEEDTHNDDMCHVREW